MLISLCLFLLTLTIRLGIFTNQETDNLVIDLMCVASQSLNIDNILKNNVFLQLNCSLLRF